MNSHYRINEFSLPNQESMHPPYHSLFSLPDPSLPLERRLPVLLRWPPRHCSLRFDPLGSHSIVSALLCFTKNFTKFSLIAIRNDELFPRTVVRRTDPAGLTRKGYLRGAIRSGTSRRVLLCVAPRGHSLCSRSRAGRLPLSSRGMAISGAAPPWLSPKSSGSAAPHPF